MDSLSNGSIGDWVVADDLPLGEHSEILSTPNLLVASLLRCVLSPYRVAVLQCDVFPCSPMSCSTMPRSPGVISEFWTIIVHLLRGIYLLAIPLSTKMILWLRGCVRVLGVADARTCTPTAMPILGAFPESFASRNIAFAKACPQFTQTIKSLILLYFS